MFIPLSHFQGFIIHVYMGTKRFPAAFYRVENAINNTLWQPCSLQRPLPLARGQAAGRGFWRYQDISPSMHAWSTKGQAAGEGGGGSPWDQAVVTHALYKNSGQCSLGVGVLCIPD